MAEALVNNGLQWALIVGHMDDTNRQNVKHINILKVTSSIETQFRKEIVLLDGEMFDLAADEAV